MVLDRTEISGERMSPQTKAHMETGANPSAGKGQLFQQMDVHMQKNKGGPLTNTICKN